MAGHEIRVHLSGPSSVVDDRLYREMLRAYNDFEALNVLPKAAENLDGLPSDNRGECSSQSLLSHIQSTYSASSKVSDEPAVVQSVISPSLSPGSGTRDIQDTGSRSCDYISNTPEALAALESQLLTSSLRALSPNVSSPLLNRGGKKTLSVIDEPSGGSQTEYVSAQSQENKQCASPNENLHASKDDECPSSKGLQPSSGISSAKPEREPCGSGPSPKKDVRQISQAILPPSPATALSSPPTSFITPKLQQLADIPNMSGRFKPLRQEREIQPLERGYWQINGSSWSDQIKTEFWTYLDEFVGSGAAGWGVSCYSGAVGANEGGDVYQADANVSLESSTTDRREKTQFQFNSIRIYCWGEIVSHIYLLVFVASRSKVKHTKAAWVDSDGQEVVIMA